MADEGPNEEAVSSTPRASLDFSDIQTTGNGRILAKHDGSSPAMSCAVFPENFQLAVGWSSGIIKILNALTFEEVSQFGISNDLPATYLSAYKSGDRRQLLLSSYASGETIMWNVPERSEVWKITEDRQSLVNAFNCDHTKIAVSGSDAKISIYDVEDQKQIQVLQGSVDPDVMDGHTMRVFSVKFHPTIRHELISGGWDDTVQFWDIREPFSRRKVRGPHICGDGIEFLGEYKFITASWSRKKSLQTWDYRSTKPIEVIRPDDWTCFLYCCRFIESESTLLTGGSHKNMMRVIDMNIVRSVSTFRNLPGAVYFARELPKQDSLSYISKFCFCSDTSVYMAQIEG